MLKLSRSQNLLLAGIIAGLEVGKHTSMSTWLHKTELQYKIIIHFLWKMESHLFMQMSRKILCQGDLYMEFSLLTEKISVLSTNGI